MANRATLYANFSWLLRKLVHYVSFSQFSKSTLKKKNTKPKSAKETVFTLCGNVLVDPNAAKEEDLQPDFFVKIKTNLKNK